MTTETLDRPTNALVLKFNASKLLIEELSTELKSLKDASNSSVLSQQKRVQSVFLRTE